MLIIESMSVKKLEGFLPLYVGSYNPIYINAGWPSCEVWAGLVFSVATMKLADH